MSIMTIVKFAFDRSARTVDADGRLHIARSHISKAAVNPYYGEEIPDWKNLGLDSNRVYRLLRDPVELERGADTFKRIFILKKHVPLTVDNIANDEELKKLIIGSIGSDVEFKKPYLDADLCFWDSGAIAGIDTDQVRELSCAYRYVPVMEPGEYEGEAYDGRMTEIKGNHLALVEFGRAGSDVVVADSNPFTKETQMKMTKLGKALFASLSAASPKLAADSALPGLVGTASRKTFNAKDAKAKLIAMDSGIEPEKVDSIVDTLLDVEQDPNPMEPKPAVDETPAGKLRAMLAGKVDDAVIEEACKLFAMPAADGGNHDKDGNPYPRVAKDDDLMNKEEVVAAMDSMAKGLTDKLTKQFREVSEAQRDVRQVVGDVIGMDSAEAIYGFALDHMKIDRAGVDGVPALRALFKVASSKPAATVDLSIAQDSGDLYKTFPNLSRFRAA